MVLTEQYHVIDIYYFYQATNLLNAPCNLHGKLLAGRPRSKFFLQWHPSFREMLDQVHFSCKGICWKV